MGKSHWNDLDDGEFEIALCESVDEDISSDIVGRVMPCSGIMHFILIGLALQTITFNFFNLNYILPFIGMILSLLGYRKLRDENIFFKLDYISEWICMVYWTSFMILNTTIIHCDEKFVAVAGVLEIMFIMVRFAQLVCLWLGIRKVQKKAGLVPGAYSAGLLIVWYVLVLILGIVKYNSFLSINMLVVVYVLVLFTMHRLSKELDEAGYAVRLSVIKVTDKVIASTVSAVLILGCVCGYIFGSRYHMDWSIAKNSYIESVIDNGYASWKIDNAKNDVAKIRENLMEQGFPDYVLNDLTDEEIAACDGALDIVTSVNKNENGLQFTDVAVLVPDEDERWMIFHYYRWIEDRKFYGTDVVQVWTAYRDLPKQWASYGEITGRVMYDKDGVTYVSPYNSLETRTYDRQEWIDQFTTVTDIFGTFSFPRKGKNCRGYIVYSTIHSGEDEFFSSFINYTHQDSLMQYPVITAYKSRTTSRIERKPFATTQNHFFFDAYKVE